MAPRARILTLGACCVDPDRGTGVRLTWQHLRCTLPSSSSAEIGARASRPGPQPESEPPELALWFGRVIGRFGRLVPVPAPPRDTHARKGTSLDEHRRWPDRPAALARHGYRMRGAGRSRLAQSGVRRAVWAKSGAATTPVSVFRGRGVCRTMRESEIVPGVARTSRSRRLRALREHGGDMEGGVWRRSMGGEPQRIPETFFPGGVRSSQIPLSRVRKALDGIVADHTA